MSNFPIAVIAENREEYNEFLKRLPPSPLNPFFYFDIATFDQVETRHLKFSGILHLPGVYNRADRKTLEELISPRLNVQVRHEVGQWVQTLQEFSGVPKFTEGLIVEDYGSGVTVAWDRPGSKIPTDLTCAEISKLPNRPGNPLRDGFDKKKELPLLAIIRGKRTRI